VAQFDLDEICGHFLKQFDDFLPVKNRHQTTIGELYVTITYYENPWYYQQLETLQKLQRQQQEMQERCNFKCQKKRKI